MNDYTDQGPLCALVESAVFVGPCSVKTNHGILHSKRSMVHRGGMRIGVVNGVLGVSRDGSLYSFSRLLFPEWISFLWIVRHGKRSLVANFYRLRIPDKFPGSRERKIADILSFKPPGLFIFRFCFFTHDGFRLRCDDDWLIKSDLGFFKPLQLCCREHVFWILNHARSCNNMIGGHGEAHVIVTKCQSKFALAKKLFVLPAHDIIIHAHPRKPLCDDVGVVIVFRKIFQTTAAIIGSSIVHTVIDVKRPFN